MPGPGGLKRDEVDSAEGCAPASRQAQFTALAS